MNTAEAFTQVQGSLRLAILALDDTDDVEGDIYALIASVNEYTCDLLNQEVDILTQVEFPYEQGDGGEQ